MRILSSFVLMAGMVFVLAAPQQSAATSLVGLAPIAGGTATCTAGSGTGGEDACTGTTGDSAIFAITMSIDAAGTNAWSIDLAWDSGLQSALHLVQNTAPSSLSFENPSPPPSSAQTRNASKCSRTDIAPSRPRQSLTVLPGAQRSLASVR